MTECARNRFVVNGNVKKLNDTESEKALLLLNAVVTSPPLSEQTQSVDVNMDEATRFLALLDPETDTFLFSSFDDDKSRDKMRRAGKLDGVDGVKPQERLSKLASAISWMNGRQAKGANVCCTVQAMKGKTRTLEGVAYFRAIFAEMDQAPRKDWPLKPSIINETSAGKFHVYWLVDAETPMDGDTFEAVQKRLVLDYGADNGAKDRARTLRLPGTWNLKTGRPPHLVKVIDESGYRYTVDEITAAFPPVLKEKAKRGTRPSLDRFTSKGDLGRFIQPLGHVSPDEYMTWLEIGMTLHDASGGSAEGLRLWDSWSSGSTKWSAGECDYRWRTFRDGKGVTGGTVFFHAEGSGYRKQERPQTRAKQARTAETVYSEPQVEQDEAEDIPAFSDDGLALSFAAKHKNTLRYVAVFNKWMFWTGQHWQEEETHLAFDLANKHCRAASRSTADKKEKVGLCDAKTRANVLTLARADRRIAARKDQWDRDNWLLNTPGGMVHLKTGELMAHDPAQYMTKMTTVSPGRAAPKWQSFLDDVTDGNKELQSFLQRVAGYCLTGHTTEHALFFCHGKGGNGKGVFLNTITGILNAYARPAPIETFTESKTERHPTDLAGLVGARLVTASETEEGRHWAEAKVKQLTGGDEISARFMRGDFFQYVPNFKLFIVGNHKPQIRNVDDAMRRRFHLIPFTVTIPPEKKNPNLSEELKAEWGGILQWMIDGCLDWQRQGLAAPADVKAATADYMEAEDSTQSWLEEMTLKGSGTEQLSSLFLAWKRWADLNNIAAGTNKKLRSKLEDRGFKFGKNGKGVYISGLSLRQDVAYTAKWND